MILGDPLTFDLTLQDIQGREHVVLEIGDLTGRIAACKWEADANPYQVAAALERMAAKLRNPKI